MSLSRQPLLLPSLAHLIFQLPPLGFLMAPHQKKEVICCWLRAPISWVGLLGTLSAESLVVQAQKLWLLFLTSPGAQLGALPQSLCRVWPSPCLVLVSVTWRWLSYFFITVMSFKFLFL